MSGRKTRMLGNMDGWLVILYLFLILFGWLNIYSSSFTEERGGLFDLGTSHGKQLLWMGICCGAAVFILLLDSRIFPAFAYVFYGITIVLLGLVLVIGQEVDGNKSWFVITDAIKIQPSEFAKFSTALVLAKIIGDTNFSFTPTSKNRALFTFFRIPFLSITKEGVFAFLAVLASAGLILAENDTGSTLVFLSFILAFFRFGFPWIFLIAGVMLVVLFFAAILIPTVLVILGLVLLALIAYFLLRNAIGGWKIILLLFIVFNVFTLAVKPIYNNILKEHHRTRIMVLLGKEKDLKGSGWNVNNSKMAIGSGGLSGKGFMKGSLTKLKFVPKQRTDFIFSTVGEEWGFWGSSLIILIYLFFMVRLLQVAERQRSQFSMVYGYCVACVMFFHFFMNIGTTIGLAPAVGIPLPFFSYGGSSLLGFTLLLWVFIRLDSQNLQILR